MSWTPPHRPISFHGRCLCPIQKFFELVSLFPALGENAEFAYRLLSWIGLFSEDPKAAPRYLCLGQKLSSEQWEIVKTLNGLSEDANSPLEVDASMMGRSAPKNELADLEIAALHRACAIFESRTRWELLF